MEAVAVVDEDGVVETDSLGLEDGDGRTEDEGLLDAVIEAIAVVDDVGVTDSDGVVDGMLDGATDVDADGSAVSVHNLFMTRFLHGYLRIRNSIR